MSVNHFKSTDPGALVLSGQAGALIAILDIVLVALGWTIAFPGANKRAYRMNNTTQSGRYLRVDDSNARYAIVNAYNAMTDVDTGTGGFPAVGTARYIHKSDAASSAARPWAIYGDEGFVHVFPSWHTTYGFEYYAFGDLVDCPDVPGQVTLLMASPSAAPSWPGSGYTSYNAMNGLSNVNNASTHLIPTAAGTLTGTIGNLFGHTLMGTSLGRGGGLAPISGTEANGVGLRASEVDVVFRESHASVNNWLAGKLPGLLAPWWQMPPAHAGTIFNDLIGGDARRYRGQALYDGSGTAAVHPVYIDIDGPWRQ